MKILFLDIDGVLVPAKEACREYRYCGINPDPLAIVALNRIIKATGAKICVSSTLRLGQSINSLQSLMEEWNITAEVVGLTPYLWQSAKRGDEIAEWIKVFESSREKITGMVILDDKDADLESYKNYLVQPDYYEGLTEQQADTAIELLNSEGAVYAEQYVSTQNYRGYSTNK